jgi:hypothetical protein
MLHRPLMVYRMPQIQIIDGIPVSEEERARADLYFMEQQVIIDALQVTSMLIVAECIGSSAHDYHHGNSSAWHRNL